MVDHSKTYQPNRFVILILEELNEEMINAPINSLLTANTMVIDIVSITVNSKQSN